MGLITAISQKIMTSIFDYIKSRYAPLIDKSNTASGTDTITLDKSSGVLEYSSSVTTGGKNFTFNNNLVKVAGSSNLASIVSWSINYIPEDAERIIQGSYYIPANGQVVFFVNITGGASTVNEVLINFRIE